MGLRITPYEWKRIRAIRRSAEEGKPVTVEEQQFLIDLCKREGVELAADVAKQAKKASLDLTTPVPKYEKVRPHQRNRETRNVSTQNSAPPAVVAQHYSRRQRGPVGVQRGKH